MGPRASCVREPHPTRTSTSWQAIYTQSRHPLLAGPPLSRGRDVFLEHGPIEAGSKAPSGSNTQLAGCLRGGRHPGGRRGCNAGANVATQRPAARPSSTTAPPLRDRVRDGKGTESSGDRDRHASIAAATRTGVLHGPVEKAPATHLRSVTNLMSELASPTPDPASLLAGSCSRSTWPSAERHVCVGAGAFAAGRDGRCERRLRVTDRATRPASRPYAIPEAIAHSVALIRDRATRRNAASAPTKRKPARSRDSGLAGTRLELELSGWSHEYTSRSRSSTRPLPRHAEPARTSATRSPTRCSPSWSRRCGRPTIAPTCTA